MALSTLEPFTLLFDDEAIRSSLPEPLGAIYQGSWQLPNSNERPYIYSNFVQSRDGRVSFGVPGHLGGGDVSGFNQHDQWLMGLLRARADAVVVGDNTLRLEPEHLWTAEFICPSYAQGFAGWRKLEQRKDHPLQVFLSFDGKLPQHAKVFQQGELELIVATSSKGYQQAKRLNCTGKLHVLELGNDKVDLRQFVKTLYQDFGVKTLLCEGGPRVYGAFLAAQLIDEEFLTLSPTVIGNAESPRPGLVEGVAFMPERYPRSKPISLRRAGDHLFLRSRYSYP